MTGETRSTRPAVTPSDLRIAAAICRRTLSPVSDGDWSVPAHGLDWDCRTMLDHACDCLAFYAHDLAGRIQIVEGAARDGFAGADPLELIRTVEILTDVLTLVADGSPAEVRAFHPFGMADPEGFLAMGAVETLLHTWDIATALGVPLTPTDQAEALAGKIVARLFPWAPAGVPAMNALLACTGRGEVAGFASIGTRWRWHAAPVAEWDGTIPLDLEAHHHDFEPDRA